MASKSDRGKNSYNKKKKKNGKTLKFNKMSQKKQNLNSLLLD